MKAGRFAYSALAMLCLASDVAAQAQLPGYGHAASGMGGASIALPYDAAASANNTAGMAFVGSRSDILFTTAFINATTGLGPFQFEASDLGFAPTGGFNWDLKNGWTVGVSIFGFGSGTDYEKPLPGNTTNTHSSIAQVVVAPTVTYRVGPNQAIGFALLIAAQRLELGGLQSFGFQDTGSESSYGVGASIGYLGELAPGLRLGLTYSSRVDMGRLDKYSSLLADGGNQDIPQQAGIGLSWQVTPQLIAAFDYLWINWSSVRPLGNPFPGNGPAGSVDGPGFGWQDQSIYRLGLAFDADDRWTFRTGGTYKTKLIVPEYATLNTLAALVPQVTFTLGATYRVDSRHIVSAAYAHNFERTVTGTQASTGVTLTSSANFITVGYGYQF